MKIIYLFAIIVLLALYSPSLAITIFTSWDKVHQSNIEWSWSDSKEIPYEVINMRFIDFNIEDSQSYTVIWTKWNAKIKFSTIFYSQNPKKNITSQNNLRLAGINGVSEQQKALTGANLLINTEFPNPRMFWVLDGIWLNSCTLELSDKQSILDHIPINF